MKNIIRKILTEEKQEMFLNRVILLMKDDFPIFKNLQDYGLYSQLSKEEIIFILKGLLGDGLVYDFRVEYGFKKYEVYNINNKPTYIEYYDGDWYIPQYD